LKEENGLEINPFFVDVKFDLNNKNNNNNYISEIEEKKVNEILTKKNNNELKAKISTNTLLLNSNKNTDNKPILKKEKSVGQRTKTTKSLIINNSKNCSFLNKGNPGQVKKTVRHNTCIFKKSKILPEKNILNEFKPLKDKPIRKRQFTVYNKSSNLFSSTLVILTISSFIIAFCSLIWSFSSALCKFSSGGAVSFFDSAEGIMVRGASISPSEKLSSDNSMASSANSISFSVTSFCSFTEGCCFSTIEFSLSFSMFSISKLFLVEDGSSLGIDVFDSFTIYRFKSERFF